MAVRTCSFLPWKLGSPPRHGQPVGWSAGAQALTEGTGHWALPDSAEGEASLEGMGPGIADEQ